MMKLHSQLCNLCTVDNQLVMDSTQPTGISRRGEGMAYYRLEHYRLCLHTAWWHVCFTSQNTLLQPAIGLYGDFAISEELQKGLADIIAKDSEIFVMVCMTLYIFIYLSMCDKYVTGNDYRRELHENIWVYRHPKGME